MVLVNQLLRHSSRRSDSPWCSTIVYVHGPTQTALH